MNQNQNLVLYRMMEGQAIQQYRLETLLGAGGFGGVFKAAEVVRDKVMRHLAVKLVSNIAPLFLAVCWPLRQLIKHFLVTLTL